jgi:hypothetical protein
MVITPEVIPVILFVNEFTLPVTDKLVPVATPNTGVVSVGDVCNTTLPVPVAVVDPVPPFKMGNAVPDNVTANIPLVVIGDPEIERNEGTVKATLVTVPVDAFVQVIADAPPPALVNTCPLVPAVIGKLKLYVPAEAWPCMVITPEVLPVIVDVRELTLPVTESEVPVADPNTGVVNVGDVCNTTLPDPVAVVDPVPPLTIGNAVPDNVTANVPDVVIGEPEIERNEGTVNATLVTVPVVGVVQVIADAPPPALVNI